MRKLFLLLFLLFPVIAQATVIPITGTIVGPDGTLFTGSVQFTLSYSAARDTTNNNMVVASKVTFPVIQGQITGNAKIVPNTDLQPQFTYYTVDYYDAYSANVAENIFYISGSSFDLGSAIPTTVVTQNISFASLGNFWTRTQDPNNIANFNVYPITLSDRVLVGLNSSDINDQAALISGGFLYSASAALNASVGGLGYLSGGLGPAVVLASDHTGTGTTVPIKVVIDGTQLDEFFPGGGEVLGAPTGGNLGIGTLNSTGLFVNGVAVSAGSATSGFTVSTPFVYPTQITNKLVLGATTEDLGGSSSLVAVNPSFIAVTSASTNGSYVLMSVPGGAGVVSLASGHSGSGTTLPLRFNFAGGAEVARMFPSTGDTEFGKTTDSGYKVEVAGTLNVTGFITGASALNLSGSGATVSVTNTAFLGNSAGYMSINAPSGYSGNPTMNVFFKPDGIDFLGTCGLGNYPCGAAIAVGNDINTIGSSFGLYTDHGTLGSPNRLLDLNIIQGNIYIPYIPSATGNDYVCVGNGGELSYSGSCGNRSLAELEARVQQLEQAAGIAAVKPKK